MKKQAGRKAEEQVRAAGYARVSTQEQAEGGHSLDSQQQQIRTAAQARGWQLVEEQVYIDAGASGGNVKRPALAKLLLAAQGREIDAVIVTGLDRLSRRARDLHNLVGTLEENKVALVSLRENMDCTSPIGKAVFGIMGTFAELERDLGRERTRNGMKQAKAEGHIAGRAPFGYRREGGLLVKDSEQQKALRKARRLRRAGKTLRHIAEVMGWSFKATIYRLGWKPGGKG